MGRSLSLVGLFHPGPSIATTVAGVAFAVVAAPQPVGRETLALFAGSVLLTQMAISAHNDYCDRAIDRVAKPWRPIAAGAISANGALVIAIGLCAVGVAMSAPLGGPALVLAVIGTSAGFLYSGWLKRTPLSWAPFWLGFPTLALWACAAVGRAGSELLGAYAIGLPLVLAIHLADTLPDIASDNDVGLRGLAHRLGGGWTRIGIAGCLALGIGGAIALGSDARGLVLALAGYCATLAMLGLRRDDLVRYGAGIAALGAGLAWLGGLRG